MAFYKQKDNYYFCLSRLSGSSEKYVYPVPARNYPFYFYLFWIWLSISILCFGYISIAAIHFNYPNSDNDLKLIIVAFIAMMTVLSELAAFLIIRKSGRLSNRQIQDLQKEKITIIKISCLPYIAFLFCLACPVIGLFMVSPDTDVHIKHSTTMMMMVTVPAGLLCLYLVVYRLILFLREP